MSREKENTVVASPGSLVLQRIKDYGKLLKFRLSFLVAISGAFGYMFAAGEAFAWMDMLLVGVGGLLVTGASNTLNQVIEAEHDRLMNRTKNRPLAEKRLTSLESVLYALVLGIGGILILGYFFNLVAALLGLIALLSYAFVYTPMKRVHPISVLIGAIPGGMPPLIGWAAFTGGLETGGWILFMFQFLWQFPHFWAIAWILDEDYKRAGFKMLPGNGKTQLARQLILIYTLLLIPIGIIPFSGEMIGWGSLVILILAGALFSYPAIKLFRSGDNKDAKQLMYASFLYLPLIQIVMVVDQFMN